MNPINIEIRLSATAMAGLLGAEHMEGRQLEAIAVGMDRANQKVMGRITKERLTGQGPFPVAEHRLGVVTNFLRRSLRATKAAVQSGQVVSAMGSNVQYFGVHETGFRGVVQVAAHSRRAPLGDTFALGDRVLTGKQLGTASARRGARNRQLSSRIARVKAHQRKVDIPARAPVATGISESDDIYSEEFSRAIIEGVLDKGGPA